MGSGDPHEIIHAELSDRYALEDELGRGGMATVYLAHDRKHGRKVAIKVIHPELTDGAGPKRFEREIRTTASLQHPHIVPLLDSGVAGSLLYYVTPYVEGESLRDVIRRGAVPFETAISIACEVAQALEYAHQKGIVHRDIKPENIMISHGQAVVTDLGIAIVTGDVDATTLTKTGTVVGTLAYISPEQLSGQRKIDGRADVYSLGCVVYEMLTGRPPFLGDSTELIKQHMLQKPLPPSKMLVQVPPVVERAIIRALEKRPENRHPSAKAFEAELRKGVSQRGPSPTAFLFEAARRYRLPLLGGAAVITLVVSLLLLQSC